MALNAERTLNFKVSLFFGAISVVLVVVLTFISLYAFRQFSISTATEHLRTAAEIVRVHLTESMISGVIDQRQSFLYRLAEVNNLRTARVVRSPVVEAQFGDIRKGEFAPDNIEKTVLSSGVSIFEVLEQNKEIVFRGTIPYIASGEGKPNCLQCHAAKSGDVLGAVTMTMSIAAMRHNGMVTVASIVGVVVVAVLVLFVLLRYLLNPISNTAGAIEHAVRDALDGNFRNVIQKRTNDEIGQIANDMNRLLRFLDAGLNKINDYVSQLIHRRQTSNENTLIFTIDMVKNLTRISQYKGLIEEDESKHEIYRRLVTTLSNRFFNGKLEYSIYEVADDGSELVPIIVNEETEFPCRWCHKKILAEPKHCRVFHASHMINGIIQPDICYNFKPDDNAVWSRAEGGDEEEVDELSFRQQLERDQIHRRLRGRIQQELLPDSESERERRYTLCFPIRKSRAAVASIVQLVVKEADRDRILSMLPYIEAYMNDTAPVLEVRRLMDTLKESSLRDAMTGLNNRRFLEEYIDTLSASTRRKQAHVSIMMLDLDHFKMINDTYGHDAGDAVLKALANVIRSSVRASDIVVRYGGEEFMAVLQETASAHAVGVAEKIRAAVENMRIPHGKTVLQRTISIGIADFPGDSHSFWQAVKFADVALYHAKESGRNRVVHFTREMWKDKQSY